MNVPNANEKPVTVLRSIGLVRRMAMLAELAWNEIGGLAADLNVAVCEGTYAQHVEVMEKQFEREQAIRKKYAPNISS